MSEQVRKTVSGENPLENLADISFKKHSTKDIDSVLDQIDAVLEKNAEEFVKGFIQKGGQ